MWYQGMQSYVLLVPACVSACALRENVIIIWWLSIRSWVRKYLDSECTQFCLFTLSYQLTVKSSGGDRRLDFQLSFNQLFFAYSLYYNYVTLHIRLISATIING